MRFKIYLFFVQFIILCSHYECIIAKALIGRNIKRATYSELPYLVSIVRIENEEIPPTEANHICSGSLISDTHVLTAGHCVFEILVDTLRLLIGSSDIRRGLQYKLHWWILYSFWLDFRNLPREYIENDIAIIKIDGQIPNFIVPANIWNQPTNELYGVEAVTTGWGMGNGNEISRFLKKATVKVLTYEDCENRYESINGVRFPIHPRYLCTAADPYALISFGDSGGPVVFQDQIIAINLKAASYDQVPFHPGQMNFHLNLEEYRLFISDVLSSS